MQDKLKLKLKIWEISLNLKIEGELLSSTIDRAEKIYSSFSDKNYLVLDKSMDQVLKLPFNNAEEFIDYCLKVYCFILKNEISSTSNGLNTYTICNDLKIYSFDEALKIKNKFVSIDNLIEISKKIFGFLYSEDDKVSKKALEQAINLSKKDNDIEEIISNAKAIYDFLYVKSHHYEY